MRSIVIEEYLLKKVQIGVHEYEISVFESDKLNLQFVVSLQLKDGSILPSYQLKDKSANIPKQIIDRMDSISSWILNEVNE